MSPAGHRTCTASHHGIGRGPLAYFDPPTVLPLVAPASRLPGGRSDEVSVQSEAATPER
jgi:hypothetical protein